MSYEALTRHLEALRRAQPWSADEAAKRDAYAAVALKAATLVTEINPHDDAATWEPSMTTIADLRDALDALQAALLP